MTTTEHYPIHTDAQRPVNVIRYPKPNTLGLRRREAK